MTLRSLFLPICLLCTTLCAYGQTFTVSGRVINPDSIPLSDVSVVMQRLDSTYVSTTITDEQGVFRLHSPENGYRLLFSHLNYSTVVIEGNSAKVGTVLMKPYTQQLQEVTVSAERPLVKVENGNLNYDLKVLMGDRIFDNAFDVLKEIPLVKGDQNSLDIAGSMGGTSIIINGRPSNMSLSQLYTYLKSLPAEKLEKAELTYNAPPQWHVRGAAINVIIKKSDKYEVQGQVQGSWNHKHVNTYTGVGSLFVSNKTYSYDVIYNYQDSRFASQINTDGRHTIGNEVYDIHSVAHWRNKAQNHNLFGNFNYNAPKNNNIGISYYGQFSPKVRNRSFTENNLFSDALSMDAGDNYLHDVRLSYDAPFGLRISGEYTHYNSDRRQDMQYFRKDGNTEDAFRYDRNQRLQQYLVTADMSHKLPKGWNLSYGGQYKHTRSKNGQDYAVHSGQTGDSYQTYSIMNEDMASMYVGAGKSFLDGKLYAFASLTGEYYRINDYEHYDLIPNASLTYRIHPKHIVQLVYYTYRNYPAYWQRQDYVTHQDEYTTSYGNPLLRPAQRHMANFVYVLNNKYVLQMSYFKVKGFFIAQSYQSPDELQMINQTINTDYSSSFLFSLSVPVSVGKKFTSNLNATLYQEHYKAGQWFDLSFNRKKWAGLFSANNTLIVSQKPDISINATAFYRTPTIQGIWDLSQNWGVDAGIKWRFAKDKAILSLQCYDIFEKAYPTVKVRYATQWQDMDDRKYRRSIMLSFTYKFNNYKEKRRRSVDTSRFGTN